MVLRDLSSRAAERIKSVFRKDNRFFYGTAEERQEPWQEDAQPVQGTYPQGYAQPQPGQPVYSQQAVYQQPVYQQPVYQQPVYQQQPYAAPQQAQFQPAWQAQQVYADQPAQGQAPQQPGGQYQSPQQAQLSQQPEQTGRNRRAAQHAQPEAQEGNLVQFPGSATPQDAPQMDAYVVNVTGIAGCRQAMTCLRKGNCTLVVIDQLIDKAEVRRYVDMLNGACFALGGTMTRLSTKVGFYILAPSGMMVYTDPITASANAPQPRTQPHYPQQPVYQQQPQQAPYQAAAMNAQPVYAAQQGYPQQPAYQQQPQQAAPYQEQQAYAPQPNPYAPPRAPQGGQEPYQAQPYAQ
ncbi:MAG: cell division protein SepF [Clostridiales bacterium]|nr:cell division protein SepF [Clostridiales bacterium]